MKKAELYSKIVTINSQTGQGLSGLFFSKIKDGKEIVQELVDEGLVEIYYMSNSFGSEEANTWVFPSKGYCIWREREPFDVISYVRFYLNILEENSRIEPSDDQFRIDPDLIKKYSIWLKSNQEELIVMKNLDPMYPNSDGLNETCQNYVNIIIDKISSDKPSDILTKLNHLLVSNQEIIPMYEKLLRILTDKEEALEYVELMNKSKKNIPIIKSCIRYYESIS